MAVFDGQWVGYWWPELLVWLATLGLLVSLPIILWRQRRRRRLSERRIRRGVTVYLDDTFVRELRDADEVQFEEKDIHTSEGGGSLSLKLLHVGKRASVTREILRKVQKNSEPIALIGGMLDVLDRADEIVRVNLIRKEITSNPALAASLNVAHDDLPDSVRLFGTGGFVLLHGMFRVVNDPATAGDGTVTLTAAYGQPPDPTTGPQVVLTCATQYMRFIPDGPMIGRSLGWVEKWDAQAGRLIFHPIALFR